MSKVDKIAALKKAVRVTSAYSIGKDSSSLNNRASIALRGSRSTLKTQARARVVASAYQHKQSRTVLAIIAANPKALRVVAVC